MMIRIVDLRSERYTPDLSFLGAKPFTVRPRRTDHGPYGIVPGFDQKEAGAQNEYSKEAHKWRDICIV